MLIKICISILIKMYASARSGSVSSGKYLTFNILYMLLLFTTRDSFLCVFFGVDGVFSLLSFHFN